MIRAIYFLFVLVGCSAATDQKPTELVNAEKLKQLQSEGVTVIDIRTRNEYDEGHIPGVLHVDFLAEGFIDEIKKQDVFKPIVIHCASGGRSGRASKMMEEVGFKTIYDYSGGFSDWKAKGLEIEK
ncbi:MAG: rhodanese-like domain-containing protein [Ekhidna sp.]|uniref:rhodanese-like domain-containing protein n=1 Tax=Ekhidna sp. TaxID=2608089 RepID=UPI0032F00BD4